MSWGRRNYFRAGDSEHHWLLVQQMKWFLFPSLPRPWANRPLFVVNAKNQNVAVLLYWIQRKETKGKDHSTSGLFNQLLLESVKYYHGLFTYQARLSGEKSLSVSFLQNPCLTFPDFNTSLSSPNWIYEMESVRDRSSHPHSPLRIQSTVETCCVCTRRSSAEVRGISSTECWDGRADVDLLDWLVSWKTDGDRKGWLTEQVSEGRKSILLTKPLWHTHAHTHPTQL